MQWNLKRYKPQREKTYLLTCALAKTQISLRISAVWSIFVVCMKKKNKKKTLYPWLSKNAPREEYDQLRTCAVDRTLPWAHASKGTFSDVAVQIRMEIRRKGQSHNALLPKCITPKVRSDEVWINKKWLHKMSATFKDVHSDMCAQRRLSQRICAVWLESSLGAFWIAKDAKFLHADNKDSDQMRGCAGWFESSVDTYSRMHVFSCCDSNSKEALQEVSQIQNRA